MDHEADDADRWVPGCARSRRLALGRLISVTGGAAAYTALNYTVWQRTHSPKMQALSLLLTFGVAGILGPLGGALGDRLDRRKVMIASEAVSAVVFVAMVPIHDPGLLIGGLLVGTVGASWVFGLNALSFLVSLVITVRVRGRFHEERTAEHDEHQG